LLTYKIFMEGVVVLTLKGAYFTGNKKFSVLYKSLKWSEGSQPPPCALFPHQNFDIAILFKIVQRENNYASWIDKAPRASRGRAVNCARFPLLTYKVFVGGVVV
jgi:hypothetical protein